MKTQMIRNYKSAVTSTQGFTLLEVLVVTGIIGILFVVSSQIFINTIRSANKANITNEARENGSLVSESLQRDVHRASAAVVTGTTDLRLTYSDLSEIRWVCNSGFISRQVGAGIAYTVTNRDETNGINVPQAKCSFTVLGSVNTLVTLDFEMTQGGSAGASQDSQISVQQRVVATTRGY